MQARRPLEFHQWKALVRMWRAGMESSQGFPPALGHIFFIFWEWLHPSKLLSATPLLWFRVSPVSGNFISFPLPFQASMAIISCYCWPLATSTSLFGAHTS